MYVTLPQVQAFLNIYKYDISIDEIDQEIEALYVGATLAGLEQRYDTSPWTDDTTTPPLVRGIISMQIAAAILRKAISEDDGTFKYANWLDQRALKLIEGLANGALDLPGVDPDPNAPAAGSVGFFPTAESTLLWFEEGNVEGASARHFDSQMTF